MEPLKRLTQCGNLAMLLTAFIILSVAISSALITFGKSQNQVPQGPPPNAVKPRICKSHNDCSVQHTSCVIDPVLGDGKMRCVCGDNKWPEKGNCTYSKKQFRHRCGNVDECAEGMLCAYDVNVTKPSGHSRDQDQFQVCLCNNDEGYFAEKDDINCNESGRLISGIFVPLISLIVGILISRKQSNY